jgi:hypothetical protein
MCRDFLKSFPVDSSRRSRDASSVRYPTRLLLELLSLPVVRGADKAVPLQGDQLMHGIIYLVGLIVVIMAILSFFGLR